MAWEITGVGVAPKPAWIMMSVSSAAKTSTAVTNAASERAWVSIPRKSGPVMPRSLRSSQMARQMAATCPSLKLLVNDDPR